MKFYTLFELSQDFFLIGDYEKKGLNLLHK